MALFLSICRYKSIRGSTQMRICKSPGCSNETRGRRFNTKDNGTVYYEKTCRSCENALRRYGMTGPERKAEREVKGPSIGLDQFNER